MPPHIYNLKHTWASHPVYKAVIIFGRVREHIGVGVDMQFTNYKTNYKRIMELIALGLENRNPAAYFLIFLILYPPSMCIIFAIVDWIKGRKH